jgi:general stress protein YciG
METEPKKRGFAAMSPERRREIASKGGASVPNEKRAFPRTKNWRLKRAERGATEVAVAVGRQSNGLEFLCIRPVRFGAGLTVNGSIRQDGPPEAMLADGRWVS